MKIYCPECGVPNPYASKKPNFCQNCGNSLGSKSNTAPKKTVSTEIKEEEEYFEVPEMNQLDIEVTPYERQGVTLGEVVDSGAPLDEQPLRATPTNQKKLSKKAQTAANKQVLLDLQKEAGALRRSNKNE